MSNQADRENNKPSKDSLDRKDIGARQNHKRTGDMETESEATALRPGTGKPSTPYPW
jgi:hypothetical protein